MGAEPRTGRQHPDVSHWTQASAERTEDNSEARRTDLGCSGKACPHRAVSSPPKVRHWPRGTAVPRTKPEE